MKSDIKDWRFTLNGHIIRIVNGKMLVPQTAFNDGLIKTLPSPFKIAEYDGNNKKKYVKRK